MDALELKVNAGDSLTEVCNNAVTLARQAKRSVKFIFRDVPVVVFNHDTVNSAMQAWALRASDGELKRARAFNEELTEMQHVLQSVGGHKGPKWVRILESLKR